MGQKYPGISVSGYNSVPPSDDSAQTEANKVKWSTHKTKIGDPLNTAIVAIDGALTAAFAEEALLKTTNYTSTLVDHHKLIECTGTITISLLDASTGAASYQVNVLNVGTGLVTVGRATAGNFINGTAQNWVLNPGDGASFRVNAAANGYDVVASAAPVYNFPTSSGGTLAYFVSFAPAITAYYAGQDLKFMISITNTGAVTLAVNGLAAKNVVKEGGAVLVAGDFPAGTVAHVIYSGAEFRLNRTAATSLTTLATVAQLDAKVYATRITNGGAASVAYGPAGWSVARTGAGLTTITHNLGTGNYAISMVGDGALVSFGALGANTFDVRTFNDAGTTLDAGYSFVLARN